MKRFELRRIVPTGALFVLIAVAFMGVSVGIDALAHEVLLASVATDPKATPTTRVLSTYALKNASDETQAKLRVAVEETAEPRLHEALEEAVDGETTPDRLKALRSAASATSRDSPR